MKVIQLNHSDIHGGAARAAYRIHHCLRSAEIDSLMWVNEASAGDWTVVGPINKFEKVRVGLNTYLVKPLRRALRTENSVLHSPSILPSTLVKRINHSSADIVHLHWVQGEMLSIADIGRIAKPIVWTLHDMWPFCGAEHYTMDYRWRDGYQRGNRPSYEAGFDLNLWTWQRKIKHWRNPMHIVGNSRWMSQCASQSVLMRGWPIEFIYYPIDLTVWAPVEKKIARSLLGLPTDVPLVAFGAMGGATDSRKGFDLLVGALQHMRNESSSKGLELVVFGQSAPKFLPDLGFPVHYVGHLHDNVSLRILYSAVDALVVPSRMEAFGQTASEAHACGTPVVAFDIGGLPDIIKHKQTGYLAEALDTQALADGILWTISDAQRNALLGLNARASAIERFSPEIVAAQYLRVYQSALGNARF